MKKLTLIVAGALLLAGITGCEVLNKMKNLGSTPSAGTAPAASTSAAADVLPFSVKLDGTAAKPNNDICAIIAGSVSNSAVIEVGAPTDEMIIINAFPSDVNGKIPSGAKAAIILIKKGENKTTIDKTTDNKKLAAGTYLMNVVGGGKTARVVFTVK